VQIRRCLSGVGQNALVNPEQEGRAGWQIFISGVLAALILVLPAVAFIAGERGRPSQNRPLAEIPNLTEGWGTFDQMARYLDDRIPLRSRATQLDSWIDRNFFDEDPAFGGASSPLVVQGENGFAFLAEDFEVACSPTGSIEQSVNTVEILERLFTSAERKFLVSIAPNKSTVLEGQVPKDLALGPCWKAHTDQLWESLRSSDSSALVDLRSELETSDLFGNRDLYFKTDSHWSSAGSLVVMRTILNRLSPGAWDESDVQEASYRDYIGDLSLVNGSQRSEQIAVYELARLEVTENQRTILNSELTNTNLRIRNEGPDGSLVKGRTLLISDSFGDVSLERIAPYFEDLTFIHFSDWDPTLFASQMEKADTIWIMTAERYFTWRFSLFLGEPLFLESLDAALNQPEK